MVNLSVLTREMGDEVVSCTRLKGAGRTSPLACWSDGRRAPGVVARARQILARLEASEITQDNIGKNILEGRGKKKNEQMALMEYGRAEPDPGAGGDGCPADEPHGRPERPCIY